MFYVQVKSSMKRNVHSLCCCFSTKNTGLLPLTPCVYEMEGLGLGRVSVAFCCMHYLWWLFYPWLKFYFSLFEIHYHTVYMYIAITHNKGKSNFNQGQKMNHNSTLVSDISIQFFFVIPFYHHFSYNLYKNRK